MTDIPARLTVVTLGARDMPGLRRFYRALGWEEVESSGDGWSGFLLGGVLLSLYPLEDLAAEAAAGAPAPAGWSGFTLACNVDGPEQVDESFAAAVRAGAAVVAEPVERPWGGRSAYVADPEGNRWEIAWAPGAGFDDRGALTSFGV
ncbi:VOC family protein [Nocardiopsis tropica]|uniref:VOC family protein n=1 Tax=Nocardiopsis tropica TaxID=109330 RepID=A0ABU7KYH4_9ACTN|nr:VOC family protein [Nocardiopsis umidischolae]MEE2054358.1 VOC family protein [Nocardiopsis umidischolae]